MYVRRILASKLCRLGLSSHNVLFSRPGRLLHPISTSPQAAISHMCPLLFQGEVTLSMSEAIALILLTRRKAERHASVFT